MVITKPIVIILFFCYTIAVEVNRTVAFSWSSPIRDDPFLSMPMLPMSIPYFILEASITSTINEEYYINLPQVELYINKFDPGKNKFEEISLHIFDYEPAVLTLQNRTKTYLEFPYKDFVPDPSFFTGQTLNMRFRASTNAPDGTMIGQLGYISLSSILSDIKFPLTCPTNTHLECKTFGYFTAENATTSAIEMFVNGFADKPATMDIWGRNSINKTKTITYHLNGREWNTGQSIGATNSTYFLFSILPQSSNLSLYDYGVISWSWKPCTTEIGNSIPDPLRRFKENLMAFIVLIVASAALFAFVGLAQRCRKKKGETGANVKDQYEEIN